MHFLDFQFLSLCIEPDFEQTLLFASDRYEFIFLNCVEDWNWERIDREACKKV